MTPRLGGRLGKLPTALEFAAGQVNLPGARTWPEWGSRPGSSAAALGYLRPNPDTLPEFPGHGEGADSSRRDSANRAVPGILRDIEPFQRDGKKLID
jgi:hypothetical protein